MKTLNPNRFIAPFLILVALTWSMPTISQRQPEAANIYIGPEIKSKRKGTLNDIVGYDSNGYYMLRKEAVNYYYEHYDKDLNLMKSVEIDLGRGFKKHEMEFSVQLAKNIYSFTSFNHQKEKKNVLYGRKIDKKTLVPVGEVQTISEFDYRMRSNDGFFDYDISRDSSKFMVYHDLPYKRGKAERFGVSVFDDQMAAIWQKEITLPFKDELYDVEEYKVDNQGNAYLLGIVFKGKARVKRRGKPNYAYQLLAYSDQGEKLTEYLINLESKFITDMQFEVANNGDIICAGFFSELGTFSIKGTFYLIIDGATKEVKMETYSQFDSDFLADFMNERKANRGKELYEYDLGRLELRRDGGAVLVAEQFYAQEDMRYDPYGYQYGLSRYRYRYRYGYPMRYGYPYGANNIDYFYNDILVVNIDPKGSIQWAQRIPKRQVSRDDGGLYASYALSVAKGKMFFVFNDHPKNISIQTSDRKVHNFNKGKESVVVLVTLTGAGEMSKEPLFQIKDVKSYTRPKVCEQVSWEEMIIFNQKSRKTKFARLTFK